MFKFLARLILLSLISAEPVRGQFFVSLANWVVDALTNTNSQSAAAPLNVYPESQKAFLAPLNNLFGGQTQGMLKWSSPTVTTSLLPPLVTDAVNVPQQLFEAATEKQNTGKSGKHYAWVPLSSFRQDASIYETASRSEQPVDVLNLTNSDDQTLTDANKRLQDFLRRSGISLKVTTIAAEQQSSGDADSTTTVQIATSYNVTAKKRTRKMTTPKPIDNKEDATTTESPLSDVTLTTLASSKTKEKLSLEAEEAMSNSILKIVPSNQLSEITAPQQYNGLIAPGQLPDHSLTLLPVEVSGGSLLQSSADQASPPGIQSPSFGPPGFSQIQGEAAQSSFRQETKHHMSPAAASIIRNGDIGSTEIKPESSQLQALLVLTSKFSSPVDRLSRFNVRDHQERSFSEEPEFDNLRLSGSDDKGTVLLRNQPAPAIHLEPVSSDNRITNYSALVRTAYPVDRLHPKLLRNIQQQLSRRKLYLNGKTQRKRAQTNNTVNVHGRVPPTLIAGIQRQSPSFETVARTRSEQSQLVHRTYTLYPTPYAFGQRHGEVRSQSHTLTASQESFFQLEQQRQRPQYTTYQQQTPFSPMNHTLP